MAQAPTQASLPDSFKRTTAPFIPSSDNERRYGNIPALPSPLDRQLSNRLPPPHENASGTDDSDAETEPADDDIRTAQHRDTEEEDEEDRFWEEFQLRRRHRNVMEASGKRVRYASSSSSMSASSRATSVFDDGEESDASAQEGSGRDEKLQRKRKLEKLAECASEERRSAKLSQQVQKPEQGQEKRRRGRPRKEDKETSSGSRAAEDNNAENENTSEKEVRRKPKGRVACQDPNKPDKLGRTKLFVFTGSGNLEKVKEQVERGANVNFRDNAGWTPLHEASLKGQHIVAKYLIQCGADVNARGFGDDTPLHDASSNGFPECVKLLVEAGADVFALNSEKQTPLDVCDDAESSRILEEKMNQLNRLVQQDESGKTILHRACAQGKYDDVEMLLKQGANANAKDNESWTPLHEAARVGNTAIAKLLIEHGADVNHPGFKGNSALHNASSNGHIELVKYLLDAGADVDMCNDSGENAYQVTKSVEIRRILADRMDELRKQRAASDAIDEITFISHTKQRRHRPDADDKNKSRPLSREERKIQAIMRTFEAIEQNKRPRRGRGRNTGGEDEVEEEEEEDISKAEDSQRRRRRTNRRRQKSCSAEISSSRETSVDPESRRAASKKVDPSKLDPHKKDPNGRTHLFRFAIRGDVSAVKALLAAGSNPDERDNAGWTTLHEVALRGQSEVVEVLLENGANPNVTGMDQDTPLHDAAENGHVEVVNHLLRFGANPHARNANGLTPLDIAVEKGHESIQQLLKKAIARYGKKKASQRTDNDRTIDDSNKDAKMQVDTAAGRSMTHCYFEIYAYLEARLGSGDISTARHQKRRRLVLAATLEANSSTNESASKISTEPSLIDTKIKLEEPEPCIQGLVENQAAKKHARQLSGKVLPKKSVSALQIAELSLDGPHTPIPTPPPERWHGKVKVEECSGMSSLMLPRGDDEKGPSTQCSETARPLSDAMRFLPLYTVQLFEEKTRKRSFFVLDFQVSMLLGLTNKTFWERYPDLCRRLVTAKEKDRLWSPLAHMVCHYSGCSSHLVQAKEMEKRRFVETEMFFVLLEQIVSIIKKDYNYLSHSLITITVDIGYEDEKTIDDGKPAALPASLAANNNTAIPSKRPGFGLPPKFALKLQKLKK